VAGVRSVIGAKRLARARVQWLADLDAYSPLAVSAALSARRAK
jgi:hypothetical protein